MSRAARAARGAAPATQNNRLHRKKKQAKKDGKTVVYRFEEAKINPVLKGKLQNKGVEVEDKDFPMGELAE